MPGPGELLGLEPVAVKLVQQRVQNYTSLCTVKPCHAVRCIRKSFSIDKACNHPDPMAAFPWIQKSPFFHGYRSHHFLWSSIGWKGGTCRLGYHTILEVAEACWKGEASWVGEGHWGEGNGMSELS